MFSSKVLPEKKIDSSEIFTYMNNWELGIMSQVDWDAQYTGWERDWRKNEDNDAKIMKIIEDPTFDPNVQRVSRRWDHWNGQTPLMLAFSNRRCNIAKELLEHHGHAMNVNIIDNFEYLEKTALHYAVDYSPTGYCLEAIELLLQHPGIDESLTWKDGSKQTPLECAIEYGNGDVINLFKKYNKIPKALKDLV